MCRHHTIKKGYTQYGVPASLKCIFWLENVQSSLECAIRVYMYNWNLSIVFYISKNKKIVCNKLKTTTSFKFIKWIFLNNIGNKNALIICKHQFFLFLFEQNFIKVDKGTSYNTPLVEFKFIRLLEIIPSVPRWPNFGPSIN